MIVIKFEFIYPYHSIKQYFCVFLSIFSGVAEGQECDDPETLDFDIVIEAGLKMFGPSHVIQILIEHFGYFCDKQLNIIDNFIKYDVLDVKN